MESLKIALLGSGALAENLARKLAIRGHTVYTKFRESPRLWELRELEEAKLQSVDLVITSTGRDDSSLALALAASRIFGKRALAVVLDPYKARTYQKHSIHSIDVVCATFSAEETLVRAVEGDCRPGGPALDYRRVLLLWLLAIILFGLIWPLFLYWCVLPAQRIEPTLEPRILEERPSVPASPLHAHRLAREFDA